MNQVPLLTDPAQVRWQCRRGMLELDMMLMSFFEKSYQTLPLAQQQMFVALLRNPDQQLYEWLIGRETPTCVALQAMIVRIREGKWKE